MRGATAGIPSLSGRKRQLQEVVERTRQLQAEQYAAQLEADAATVAPDGQFDTTNFQAQLGRPLTSSELIRLLQRCNPNLAFERSHSDPTKMGVYVHVYERDPDNLCSSPRWQKRFVCGAEWGWMPEFSVRHTEEAEIPSPDGPQKQVAFKRETRGWRTVLARLIRARIINPASVDREFFPPNRGSANWHFLTK